MDHPRVRTRPLLAALLVVLAGCNGSSPTAPAPRAAVEIRLTDAASDLVSRIDVHVVGVALKPSGEPLLRVANDLGTVELLSLQGTSQRLVEAEVPPGEYEFVQLDLDADGSSVTETASGLIVPLAIAGEMVKVVGGFSLESDQRTTVLLDFQADASLQRLGDGSWLLTPVVVQAEIGVTPD